MSRNNKLYNYLVNTFSISKETILNAVNTRVEDVLSKELDKIFESNRFRKMILDEVSHIIKEGVTSGTSYYRTYDNFQKVVRTAIREEVKIRLQEDYDFNLKLELKDDKITRKL